MEEWVRSSFKAALSSKIRRMLDGEKIVGVGCSGGVDSMVLTQILAEVCAEIDVVLKVFIVEHGLREGSKTHAEQAMKELQKYGIDAEILNWEHTKLASKIEESAREARYALMRGKMQEYGIKKLFLGHHMDDNVETFFLRLGKKSDVFGLSCMSEASKDGLIRPMLGFSKAEIEGYARQNSIVYFEDETNFYEVFSRNKLRKNLSEALKLLDIETEAIAGTIAKISSFKYAFEGFSMRSFKQVIVFNGESGIFEAEWQKLEEFSSEELFYFFRILLGYFEQNRSYFRYSEIKMAVLNFRATKGFTIGKMEVFFRKNEVFFIKDASKIENAVENNIWDRRFLIESPFIFKVKTMLKSDVEKIIGEKIPTLSKIFKTLPVVFAENGDFLGFPGYKSQKVRIKGLEPSRPFNKA